MTNKSNIEVHAGKLISAVQKIWHEQLGESLAAESEVAMNRCHDLLQAEKSGGIFALLSGTSVSYYIGDIWVAAHPEVVQYIRALESAILEAKK